MSKDLVKADSGGGPQPIRRGDRQVRHLAQSVLLEEGGSSGLIRIATLTISAVVTAFLIWAAFTEVDEVAVASGEVVPTGQVQTIQHLEGGIISEILVKEGDLVEGGQVLFRLDPSASLAELEQMRARRVGLALKAERLRAYGQGVAPDFARQVPDAQMYPSLIADQQAIYDSQLVALENRRQVIIKQVEQRKSDLKLFSKREATLRRNITLLKEELVLREDLLAKGLTSKIVVLDLKRELNQSRGDISRLLGEKQTAVESMQESEKRLIELGSDLKENALTEMGGVTSELAQVRETITKLRDRVRRLQIKASVRGIVKGLKAHTLGGVIPPGGVVAELVPLEKELIVEARISTRDIGHVQVGLPVRVKVVTYDFARYGGITGELRDISASTFLDEQGEPYYKGIVALDRSYVGYDPERNRVLPGMTVQADINTGKKTLLQYLLKPVYVAMSQGFRER